MLRKTLFFSSLIGPGSRAVGGSIATNARNLEQVGHHHVSKRADGLVEAGALAESERLRDVDLHVVDEVAIPDGLEEPVGKPEGEDVLRRLLAEEVIDAEDLLFGKYFCGTCSLAFKATPRLIRGRCRTASP